MSGEDDWLWVTYADVYVRVKRLLVGDSGVDWQDLHAQTILRGDPLYFSESGMRGLASELVYEFSDFDLTPEPTASTTAGAKSVEDIVNTVWDRIPGVDDD